MKTFVLNKPNEIFVFGSNLAGRHGKGAAVTAYVMYGAKYGVGSGMQGRSYAIPTKDGNLNILPIDTIRKYVDDFIAFAISRPDLIFYVTTIGCGLAGYKDRQMAPLFLNYPSNCVLQDIWISIINELK